MNIRSHYRLWIGGAITLLAPITGLLIWRFVRLITSDDPRIWAKQIDTYKKQDLQQLPPDDVIVFTGSSSIRFWKTLEQDMAPLPVINRGFGGAKIKQVTYYADQIVLPYHPQAIVLFAGTNDLGRFKPKQLKRFLRDTSSLSRLCVPRYLRRPSITLLSHLRHLAGKRGRLSRRLTSR